MNVEQDIRELELTMEMHEIQLQEMENLRDELDMKIKQKKELMETTKRFIDLAKNYGKRES